MGDFNVAEAEVIMLEIVDPDIAKVFEEEAILWNLLDAGEAKYTNNRGVRLVTHVRQNGGMTWYGEGGPLPVGGTSRKVDMRVFYTRFAISGTLTGDAIDTTSRESLAEGLSSRMAEDTATAIKEFSQQLYENGTGIKATVTAVTTGAAGSITAANTYGVRRVIVGALYNLYSSAGVARTTGITNMTCTAVDVGAGTATFDSVPTDASASGDVLVLAGSYNRAIHGLPYHVNDDTGFYQGQSRSTYTKLKAVVLDANSAALSVSLLDKLIYRSMYRTGTKVSMDDVMIVSSPTQEHAYKSLGYNLKRFVGPGGKLDLGYKTIEHNGMPWLLDVDCSDSDIYMLRTKTWGKYQVRPLGLLREDGKVLHMIPNVTSTSSAANTSMTERYTYYIIAKCDVGCKQPHMNSRLKNLDTTNLATGVFNQ